VFNITDQEQPQKVAFYIRVSTEDQVDKFGVGLQRESLEALLCSKEKIHGKESGGYIFAGEQYVYIDEAVSGTIPIGHRPQFHKLIEDVQNAPENNKPFDVIAVFKLDRFARKLRILLDVIDFCESNSIKFISAHESIDTSTPFGRAIVGIIGILSELELENIKLRTHSGRREAVEKGVFMGTTAPYGFTKNEDKRLVVQEEEAGIVREMYNMFIIEDQSIQYIANYLRINKITSPDASATKHKKRKGVSKKLVNDIYFWNHSKVREILGNEVYTGKYYYNKNEKGKALPKPEWKLSPYRGPRIIDDTLFIKTQNKLSMGKSTANSNRSDYVYLLSGLLKCNACYDLDRDSERQTMHGSRKKIKDGKYTYFYTCRRKDGNKTSTVCASIPIPAQQLEEYVVARIREIISNPKAVYEYQQQLESTKLEMNHLRATAARIQKQYDDIPQVRERIKEQHKEGIIDMPELKKQNDDLDKESIVHKTRLKEINSKLSDNLNKEKAYEGIQVFGEKYSNALSDIYGDRNKIKGILQTIIDKIVVYSRDINEFDKIAGRKKKGQQLPYRIDISLKLPPKYLKEQADKDGTQKTKLMTTEEIMTFLDKHSEKAKFVAKEVISPQKSIISVIIIPC